MMREHNPSHLDDETDHRGPAGAGWAERWL